jgi:RNA polymerase sigma factor (sigma-70 family)
LRDPEALQGWLVRVTTNKCYHWRRQQNSRDSKMGEDEFRTIPSNEPIAPDVLAGVEREQIVRDAIGQLPPRCREMIQLLFFEQPPMPYNDLARRLKLATGSIGFIRGRCLKRMKKLLEAKGF